MSLGPSMPTVRAHGQRKISEHETLSFDRNCYLICISTVHPLRNYRTQLQAEFFSNRHIFPYLTVQSYEVRLYAVCLVGAKVPEAHAALL